MALLRVVLLGGFEAYLASGVPVRVPTKKAQALLAYLSLRPGHPHPREQLATLYWGDSSDEQARNSLRQTLFILRKAVRGRLDRALRTEADTIALSPAAIDVDVSAFQRLATVATREALEQAVTLYRGDLLEGLCVKTEPFEAWLAPERERLREQMRGVLAKLLDHQSAEEATDLAIQTGWRLLALDPLDEAVHRSLMGLLARKGRRRAALRQYQICIGLLKEELGVEPESETVRLYEEILRQSGSLPAEPLEVRVTPPGREHLLRVVAEQQRKTTALKAENERHRAEYDRRLAVLRNVVRENRRNVGVVREMTLTLLRQPHDPRGLLLPT